MAPKQRFCGSPLHAMDRRGFLGAAAAGAAAFAADMTQLNVLQHPLLGRRAEKAAEALHSPVAGGRSESTGDMGSQARSADRRTVPRHPHFGARHSYLRADAADGQADEAHLHHSFAEHAQWRSRRRRSDHDARPAR